MNFYSGLFDSMVSCCDRMGLRQGPVYTVAMMALGVGLTLNILSVTDLLWTMHLVNNPYHGVAGLHPQRYLYGLLYAAFIINTILARLKFSADHGRLDGVRVASPAAAPVYIGGSALIFLITLNL